MRTAESSVIAFSVLLAALAATAQTQESAVVPVSKPASAAATKTGTKDGLPYVWMQPGKFVIGCSPGDSDCLPDEKQIHEVTLTTGYWIGQTPVTQEAYARVTGKNPSHFKGAKLPVESVNWGEAQAYCQAIGGRLPSEAEWEYAARGSNPAGRYGAPNSIAWNKDNSGNKTHPVAQKNRNGFGLYDTLGNVWQWTADWYGAYAAAPAKDPLGVSGGRARVVRGGSWADSTIYLRVSARDGVTPDERIDTIGFRCVSFPSFTALDQAVPVAGGSGSVDVTLPEGSAWTASSEANWITFSPASGTGNATVNYKGAPNMGPARSAKITIVDTSFSVEQQAASVPGLALAGSVPDLVAQQNWTTTFTFVNPRDAPALARVSLLEDSGNPLAMPLAFPESGAVRNGSSLDRTLAPHASLVIASDGPASGPFVTGSAQVAATGRIEGYAILKLMPGAQEAVVPLETRHAKSYVLAYDNTEGAGLGVSVANVSAQAADVGVRIRDSSGAQIGSGTITIAANGHNSFALATQYPVTADQRGSIEFTTPDAGRISVLGLRTTPVKTEKGTIVTLTTIPALVRAASIQEVSRAKSAAGSIAQIAAGGGWQSTFVLMNLGASAARADLAFFDDAGKPLEIPCDVSLAGKSESAPESSIHPSAIHQTLAPGAMLFLKSAAPEKSLALIGSAQVTSDGDVGGFAILRFQPTGQEAVVPLEDRDARGYLLAYDNTDGTATGVAVNASSSQAIRIPVVIRDDQGAQIATGELPLAANGHSAFNLATQFPQTADRRGVVEFGVPEGSHIGVVGIRTPAAHTFTTLPALIKQPLAP
jgi:formylglycine-generating enzyme required for sulfatase activity